MSGVQDHAALVRRHSAGLKYRRNQDRRHDQRSRPQRSRPFVSDAPGGIRIRSVCRGDFDGSIVGHYNRERTKGGGHAVWIEMDEVLKQSQREVGGGIDHGDSRTVPAPAVNAGTFTVEFRKLAQRQSPNPHLLEDPVRDSPEDRLDGTPALLGVEQG